VSWTVVPAERALVGSNVEDLVELDRVLLGELGDRYSDEPWGPAEFLAECPAKFEISALAFVEGQIRGFWFASRRNTGAHTHRVGVARECRRGRMATELARTVHECARRLGARWMTLYVHPENADALSFYRTLGYRSASYGRRLTLGRHL
jgi:ribosomal protein S18 acetylase RimI-like enzyme